MKKWAEEADLKKWAALVIVAALAVTLTLGSVIVLVGASITISRMTNPAMQALATVAELLTGMLWLVGTVYIVTHLAVLIFGKRVASHGSNDMPVWGAKFRKIDPEHDRSGQKHIDDLIAYLESIQAK